MVALCCTAAVLITVRGDPMKDQSDKLSRSATLSTKGTTLLQKRLKLAQEKFAEGARGAVEVGKSEATDLPLTPWSLMQAGFDYALDFTQRSVLFWDTMRQRGNIFVEHERAGKPPLLHFEFETVVDGRTLGR